MADPIYVVTLKDREDLDSFYSQMESDGFKLHMKRPISRNTQYYMTEEQATSLRSDSKIAAVELRPEDLGVIAVPYGNLNNMPHVISGNFRKGGTYLTDDRDWGKLHVGGTDAQRKKNSWGSGIQTDGVEIYNDGRHVDVVICDDAVSFDCEEWKSPLDGRDRYVQYDWYQELNAYVTSIDDDGMSVPGTNYPNYFANQNNSTYHGTHVCGTVAGKHYGWAVEANIYSMQVLGNSSSLGTPVSPLIAFDYLRAFHRYKAINTATGQRNPTVTNHSWGYSSDLRNAFENGFSISDFGSVTFRGTVYSSNNPNPSGWNMGGLEKDFGLSQWKRMFNYHYNAINADVEDAVEDGVVIIGAAGNNDFYSCVPESTHDSYLDFDNRVFIQNSGTYYYNRGSSPNNAKGVICVGAQDYNSDFRRADFSNFGPRIDVWAPGVSTVSSFNSYGYADGKYGGAPNYFYPISGTSMASPQVCGVAACLATGKTRFTNRDVKGYIQQHGKYNDMTFNVNGGDFSDSTCQGANGLPIIYYDSTNLELRVDNPRELEGYIAGWYSETLKGKREFESFEDITNAQLFPRVNNFYRSQIDVPETHTISVSASGGRYYFTGDDRNTSHSNAENPTINVKVGDTINLVVNVVSHPFWISLTQGTGQSMTSNTPQSVTNNGAENATITWNTKGMVIGTYYYNCEYHSSMTGMIFVNA